MILNAAAAVYAAGTASSLREAADVAVESVDSGAARDALERLREATNA
mgnify:CR=1 FL=1